MRYPIIEISKEMISHCKKAIPSVQVHRTKTSPFDTLGGLLGELAFAEWYMGDWRNHDIYNTRGRADFFGEIEIKTSIFPFSNRLNLLVREDYANKRKPKFYIQIIISIENRYKRDIDPGTKAILSGFASSDQIDKAPLRDFGSKFGNSGGYKCRYIPIKNLELMSKFKSAYNKSNEKL